MNTKIRVFGTLLTAALVWTTAPQAGASILYLNPSSPSAGTPFLLAAGPTSPNHVELGAVGNQVILSGATAMTPYAQISRFQFDYWSTSPVTGQLFFFANDGLPFGAGGPLMPNNTGSPLYDSGVFTLPATPTGVFMGASFDNMFVPASEFTWAVVFTGLTGANEAGLAFAEPVGPGANRHPYSYWHQINYSTSWETRESVPVGAKMMFAATFEGEMVPEPSPVLYGAVLCGGIGLWFVRRRMQRPALAK